MKKILILLVILMGTTSYTEKQSSAGKKSTNVSDEVAEKIRESVGLPGFFESAKNLSTESNEESVTVANTEYFQSGKASFYGSKWNGRKTANGEIFDTSMLTAAHKTLPFGTKVKVTNVNNGKSVVVRINDRGPYVNGRVIDLSTAAFSSIESVNTGVTSVKLEIIK